MGFLIIKLIMKKYDQVRYKPGGQMWLSDHVVTNLGAFSDLLGKFLVTMKLRKIV